MRFFLFFAVFCWAYYAFPQQDTIKFYTTKQVVGKPPEIDGLINEEIWDLVEWEGDFVQRIPDYGVAPSQQTQFKILYDTKNLYIAIRAFDTEPDKIVKRMSRRDGFDGDFVEVNIDSYHDKRTAFSFSASVSGVKGDEYVSNNGNNWDATWDPIWYLATSIDSLGWIAEFRIPLSQLRFADVPEHTWGIQVLRRFFRNEERSTWQPIPQDAPGWVHLFGELRGIKGIRPQKQLEIQPYLVASTSRYVEEEGNPFATGKDNNVDLGIDAKIGITSDITLDLTINPDFGQVEADPSQVNLSAFRLYFRERRPFFLEGSNLLNFPIVGFNRNNLFYSRQIGGAPSYYPDEADYVKQPPQTRILGAAKLTGKNKNGFSWGLLESLTANEKADIVIGGEEKKVTVEPMTNYVVGRVQQDIDGGKTVVGAMVTQTHRFIDEPYLDFLHSEAYSGGVDLQHNFKDRKYGLTFRSVFSHVAGSEESIRLSQEASERFFQRPDNHYKEVDTTRTSLTGTGGTLSFGKQSGNFIWEIGSTYRSPELDLNDAGFLSQTDMITEWVFGQYRILKPVSIFRFMRMEMVQWRDYDFGGDNLSSGYEVNYRTQFTNFWRFNMGYTLNGQETSNADLRGGPSIRYPGGSNLWYYVGTNFQKPVAIGFENWHYWGLEDYAQTRGFSFDLTIRPIDALRLSFSPSVSISSNDLQYITTIEEAPDDSYLLGTVERETYRMTIRANYNLTPNLTLEFWGQPFIASGKYSDFKEAANPTHATFEKRFSLFDPSIVRYDQPNELFHIHKNNSIDPTYSFDNPNFNIREFRSNLVMRWEYVPGSTLFLVWSSNGSVFDQDVREGFRELSKDYFQLESRNTFLIKYTYRFIL